MSDEERGKINYRDLAERAIAEHDGLSEHSREQWIAAEYLRVLRLLDEARAEVARMTAPPGASAMERANGIYSEALDCIHYPDDPIARAVDRTAAKRIEQAQRDARREAIEEAAKRVDKFGSGHAVDIAVAIRALTDEPRKEAQ